VEIMWNFSERKAPKEAEYETNRADFFLSNGEMSNEARRRSSKALLGQLRNNGEL